MGEGIVSVEALEALPWPVLQRGRDVAAELWRQSLCDEEAVEFDTREERTRLIDEIEKWLNAVRWRDNHRPQLTGDARDGE